MLTLETVEISYCADIISFHLASAMSLQRGNLAIAEVDCDHCALKRLVAFDGGRVAPHARQRLLLSASLRGSTHGGGRRITNLT